MKLFIALILASLCTGCMFEAQRAFGCGNVGVFGCKDKAQPPISDGPPLRKAEERRSVLTNSRGERYSPGTPSVRLVDDCLRVGSNRTDCIDNLPPEELEKFHQWEVQGNGRNFEKNVAFADSYRLYFASPDDDEQDTSGINPGTISITRDAALGNVQDYFNEKLRESVIDRIGQPIEGFVPFMFMQALSGLAAKDFDGADGLLGEYKIVENELVFIIDEGGPIHSAAEALSEDGMKAVFANIQRRANVLITTTDEVDGLLLFLGGDLAVTECLPEQRGVDACIEIYQPVCATVNVQCVATPCDPVQETFGNSCKACMNDLVSTYTKGECPVDQ